MGWAPSEVSCLPSGFFVVVFWSGDDMILGVLYHVTCLWLRVAVLSSFGFVGLVDIWAWGGVSSGNFSVVLLNFFPIF